MVVFLNQHWKMPKITIQLSNNVQTRIFCSFFQESESSSFVGISTVNFSGKNKVLGDLQRKNKIFSKGELFSSMVFGFLAGTGVLEDPDTENWRFWGFWHLPETIGQFSDTWRTCSLDLRAWHLLMSVDLWSFESGKDHFSLWTSNQHQNWWKWRSEGVWSSRLRYKLR